MLAIYSILIIIGFYLLIKGADWLVDGASALALRLKISPAVIGLTIIAFGTSSPELFVNVNAALDRQSLICFGNIIGSNIANTLFILGVAAVIRPMQTNSRTVWKEIPFSIAAVLALFLLVMDPPNTAPVLGKSDGLLLLLFFAIFLTYVFGLAHTVTEDKINVKTLSIIKIILLLSAGFILLFLGGKLVVNNAVKAASQMGISEKVISISIISIGTSLPELVTTIVAAGKKQMDIAIGTVVGSNIANILLILGLSAVVMPLPFSADFFPDFGILLVSNILLFIFMFTGKRKIIDRWEAILFLILYIGYLIFLFLN